jgi:hypothetical protein
MRVMIVGDALGVDTLLAAVETLRRTLRMGTNGQKGGSRISELCGHLAWVPVWVSTSACCFTR